MLLRKTQVLIAAKDTVLKRPETNDHIKSSHLTLSAGLGEGKKYVEKPQVIYLPH